MGGFQAKKASAFPTSHWHMESICDKGGRSVPIKGMFFPHTWGKTGNLVVGGCRLLLFDKFLAIHQVLGYYHTLPI